MIQTVLIAALPENPVDYSGTAVRTDSAGNIIMLLAGSSATDLPQGVTKLGPDGHSIFAPIWPGGRPYAIATDASGNIYTAGIGSAAFGGGFSNCPAVSSDSNALVSKFDPQGNLIFSACLGAQYASTTAYAIAVGGDGAIYFTGTTGANFSGTNHVIANSASVAGDAFVAKLDPTGHSLLYLTIIGGEGTDSAYSIVVSSAAHACVSGLTNSIGLGTPGAAQQNNAGAALYFSADKGQTWRAGGGGLPLTPMSAVAVDPSNPLSLVGWSSEGGFYRSGDAGANWVALGPGPSTDIQLVRGVQIAPDGSGVIYTSLFDNLRDQGGLYKSLDGSHWTQLSVGPADGPPLAFAIAPTTPPTLYAAVGGFGGAQTRLYRSTDSGVTWIALTPPKDLGYAKIVIDPQTPTTLYYGGAAVFSKSVDGGATWTQLSVQPTSIEIAPSNPSIVYAEVYPYLYRSNDGGVTWSQYTGSWIPYHSSWDDPVVDPLNPNVLYLVDGGNTSAAFDEPGGTTSEMYELSGAGTAWTSITTHLSGASLSTMAIDPQTHRIFVTAAMGLDGFLACVNPDGTGLDFLTYLGGAGNDEPVSLVMDSDGSLDVAGFTFSDDFPTTADALQTSFGGGAPFREPRTISDYNRGVDGFIAKIDPTGSRLQYSTYIGGSGEDMLQGLCVAPDGSLLVDGWSTSGDLPLSGGSKAHGTGVILRLSNAGSKLDLVMSSGGPLTDLACTPTGQAYASGSGAALLSAPFSFSTGPSISLGGVVDVLDGLPGKAAPGTILSIYGHGLATSANIGSVPLQANLGGTTVSIGGIPALLFYAGDSQVNLQVPFEVHTGPQPLQVQSPQGTASASVRVANRAPVIFASPGGSLIAEDALGQLLPSGNQAQAGSVITLFLVGQGSVTNAPATGAVAPGYPFAWVDGQAQATVGGATANILYLGLVPGLVGLSQANIQIPLLPHGIYPVEIVIDGIPSNTPMLVL